MNAQSGRVRVRVVLATRTRPDVPRLLGEAATLARALQAELAGVFVEESDLLRVAELPVTREVGIASGAIRNLDLAATVRLLQRQAEEARGLLAELAAQLDLPWSFSVTRGDVVQAALEAAAGFDLVLLAPARSAVLRTLGARPAPRPDSVVAAFYDGTADGERALAAALRLADDRPEAVSLVLPSAEGAGLLRRQAARSLGLTSGLPDAVTVDDLGLRTGPRVLVVSAHSRVDVRQLLALSQCPVVLVH